MDEIREDGSPKHSILRMKLRYRLRDLFKRRRRDPIVPCSSPMILISQIQRSGGTLLSQLFDDHSELFCHPHELRWGKPQKWDWPNFKGVEDLGAEHLWKQLFNSFIDRCIREGYQKGEYSAPLPFIFDRLLQWNLFKEGIEKGVSTQRQVFDCYMTSFFNSWIDYQNLYRGSKKYTVAFTPRVNMFAAHVERFFLDYPDGFMISIVRDPLSWFASAKKHARSSRDMQDKRADNLVSFWVRSTESILENKQRFAGRYLVVLFSDLINDTREVMVRLCRAVGIEFEKTLETPTFNGIPIASNTSHKELKDRRGVINTTLEIYKTVLSDGEKDFIYTNCNHLYEMSSARSILVGAR